MLVIKTTTELVDLVESYKTNKNEIAFVPTMGNLHQGHLHLVSLAKQLAPITIVSIFVNPLQFNQKEDLEKYPRTLEQDIKLCEDSGVDILYTPLVTDIYPNDTEQQRLALPELKYLSNTLEGASRPEHFSGVVTVVKKLFDLVRPDFAVFGEKDFQQLMIVQKMVAVLQLPIQIISSETIRESDGLAMSSRNNNLSGAERKLASSIFKVLNSIKKEIISGNYNYTELTNSGSKRLSDMGFRTDYLIVCNSNDLEPAKHDSINTQQATRVILIACWLGNTRLLDNLRI